MDKHYINRVIAAIDSLETGRRYTWDELAAILKINKLGSGIIEVAQAYQSKILADTSSYPRILTTNNRKLGWTENDEYVR